MKQDYPAKYIVTALILAAGIALSGYFLSLTIYRSQIGGDTVSVKGLAEKEVQADWAQAPLFFSRTLLLSAEEYEALGQTKVITHLYQKAESDRLAIQKQLESLGFSAEEISSVDLWTKSEDFRGEDGKHTDTKVSVSGKIIVESEQVYRVRKLESAMSGLLSQGIVATTGNIKYHFSKLNDIKPEMLRTATAAARVAAKELSGSTGVKLGRIKSANQGRFSVVDKGENYGDTDRIEKTVRVVTNIKFYLTD